MVQPDALEHEQFSENTPALHINIHNSTLVIWQRGVMVSCVRRMNKVNAWSGPVSTGMGVFRRVYRLGM